jgi:hypothetical protein
MARQVENTLHSLLPPYQRNIGLRDYEIILVDNGSARMLDESVQRKAPNLRYVHIPPAEANPNPATALNHGVALSRAPLLCLMIDGARLLTPEVLAWGLRLIALREDSVTEVRGWHLGPKFQPESISEGYDEATERQLLDSIRWRENGYRLFEIAASSAQTRSGLSAKTAESNCLFMSRHLFARIGGMDERSRTPGGGLVNLDFFGRTVAAATVVFTLLGEGTFHQVHGGAATGLPRPRLESAITRWRKESQELRHTIAPDYQVILAGHLPPESAGWLARYAKQ